LARMGSVFTPVHADGKRFRMGRFKPFDCVTSPPVQP
jgi:hypothetical protein